MLSTKQALPLLLTVTLSLSACSDASPRAGNPAVLVGAQGGAPPAAPTNQPPMPAERARAVGCTAPSTVSNAPGTIVEALSLINALPKPLTLSCFLQSLARPLALRATNSVLSLQPADGPRSPRIFVFAREMTMSVVPSGSGADLLEFGETRTNYRSLKAEIVFPVQSQLPLSAAFDHLMFNEQFTTCAVCHADETQESNTSGVRQFVSRALRPIAQDRVPLERLEQELAICDFTREPERCAVLDGLLGWGAVTEGEFDQNIATF